MRPDQRVLIVVTATVAPSEDGNKVLTAVRNLLGDCEYSIAGDEEEQEAQESAASQVSVSSTDVRCLDRIHDQLRDRRVRDAARRLLERGQTDGRLKVLFNRQAAFVGVVAVSASESESPLGPIVMELDCERPTELIDWLTAH